MQTTALQSIPLPEADDPALIPYHLGLVVDALEQRGVMRFASTTARDTAIPTPVVGMTTSVGADRVQIWTGTKWLDVAGGLPDVATADGGMQNITASTYAALPAPVSVSVTLPAATWCAVAFSGWLSSAVGSNADVRVGVVGTGATTFGVGSTGATLYSGQVYVSNGITRYLKINAGTTTVSIQAYRTGTGTVSANYMHLEVLPLRWA